MDRATRPEPTSSPAPEAATGTPSDVRRPGPVAVPEGRSRLPWYGPGFIWIVASVGSGSVLFTPRVGARYEYQLLWAALLVMILIWVAMREVGRYTLISGRSILSGFDQLPGPRGWAVWVIVLPQVIASAVIVAGIAGLVGSALMIALPGAYSVYAVGAIVLSCVLVVSGRYHWVERASTLMAGLLIISALVTAAVVNPDISAFMRGVTPRVPTDFDLYFVIPWLSFVVAGPAAVLWYSYWLLAREYAGRGHASPRSQGKSGAAGGAATGSRATEPGSDEASTERFRGWMRIMSTTAGIGVFGGGMVSIAFLVLGTELLAPEGVMPEGIAVAQDLSRLLADVWGPAGFWILILGIVIALWGSILANQDGFGRLYADATLLVVPRRWIAWFAPADDASLRMRLQNTFTIVGLTLAPIAIFLVARDPVQILSIGGILAAVHMPLVVLLTLYLNRTRLPPSLRPGPWATGGMIMAGVFYAFVAVIFFAEFLLPMNG
jgi:Mn2+/Fe2+ NRAMP family transporter